MSLDRQTLFDHLLTMMKNEREHKKTVVQFFFGQGGALSQQRGIEKGRATASSLGSNLLLGGAGLLAAGMLARPGLFGFGGQDSSFEYGDTDAVAEDAPKQATEDQEPTAHPELQEPKKGLIEKAKDLFKPAPSTIKPGSAVDTGLFNKKVSTTTPGDPSISPLVSSNSLPMIRTAKASDEVISAIDQGAKRSGSDRALLYSVAGAESTFRTTVSASTSTAQGLYQFTEGTWTYLCKELKLDYAAEDRNDPEKAAYVAGMYLERIKKVLQKILGRAPSYGEIYLGYFLGPTGGARFLQAALESPDAVPGSAFDRARKANPNVFTSKGKDLSFRQILEKLEGKIQSYASDYKKSTGTSVASISAPSVTDPSAQDQPPSVSPVGFSTARSNGDPAKASATPMPIKDVLPAAQAAQIQKEGNVEAQKIERREERPNPVFLANKAESNTTLIRGKDSRIYALKD